MLTWLGILLTILVLSVWFIARPGAVPADLKCPRGIIDLHVHTAGIGAGGSGCYVSPKLKSNWRYKSYLKAFGTTEDELIENGDSVVFEKISAQIDASQSVAGAVVLALDGVVNADGELDLDETEIYIPNAFVSRETTKYANLLFGASINPYRRDSLERLEQATAEGAVLIKWLPAIQHIDPADLKVIPFYRKLAELKMPLLTHTGYERSFTKADGALGDPQRLQLPLSLGVTVIAAHAATTGKSEGEDNMARLIRMFPEHPNLYADISSLTQLNKMVFLPRLLAHKHVHQRLVYGTDFPLINTPLVSPWFFPWRLSLGRIINISQIPSPWDRDVLIKESLSVPPDVFTRGKELLRIKSEA